MMEERTREMTEETTGHHTRLLIGFRRMIKLHETMLKDVCQKYQLTLIEASIISFLHNNPGKDTAADIVDLRQLSKGNVSQAVESLIQKSLLNREADRQDRRKMHLFLREEAEPVVLEIDQMQNQYSQEMFAGLSEEEWKQFQEINDKIMENVTNAVKRREEHER